MAVFAVETYGFCRKSALDARRFRPSRQQRCFSPSQNTLLLLPMNLDLTGRTAFVGGSTQGIGRAVALELAQLGARVVLAARDENRLRETAKALPTPTGARHRWLAADFAHPIALLAALDQLLADELADAPIHILVNNTGGPAGGPVLTATPDAFRATFEQHLVVNQLLAQRLVPGMRAAGYGRIINIISTSVKAPLPNLGVSNTIRAAVASWAKTLATELALANITVNNVLPGATRTARLEAIVGARAHTSGRSIDEIETEMRREVPAGRFAEAHEIAAAVAFLASPAAAYITGINLPVDGGRLTSL
jgi:3-oxoacyl-[acyl-carrier protein] reductase